MDKKIMAVLIAVIVVVVALVAYTSYSSSIPGTGNTTITDMTGRAVHVPGEINKVLAVSPPSAELVYMLAPDKLGGWNFNLTSQEKKYMPSQYQNLPVIGGWFSTYQRTLKRS